MASAKKRSPLKGKGGLVALAVMAGLGIWLWMDLQKPIVDPNAPKTAESMGVRSEEVQRVEVRRPAGPLVLVKSGGNWRFEQPGSYSANPDNVKNWLRGLLDDAEARKVEEKQPNLTEFGLDKPQVEAVFKTGGGTRTLQIGKEFKTPAEKKASLYYARDAGSGRVFMLPASEVEGLRDKKVDDLRDKRLLALKDDKDVKSISVQRGGETLMLTRSGEDKWKLDQPIQAPAQTDDVSTLISRLKNAEADRFVEDGAKELAKYGLDKPQLTAELTTGKGMLGLAFGKAEKDGKVYAMAQGGTSVTLVSKFTWEDIDSQSKPEKLRDRQLISLDKEKIRTVELHNPKGVVKVRKISDTEWQWLDPTDSKKPKANVEKCKQVVDRATGQATSFFEEAPKDLAKYGLDKPQVTAILSDGQATQILTIGKKTKDGYYAKGAPNAVFLVSTFTFDDLNLKREDFNEAAK
jgi:hypothetical protein